jgi:predicted Zn finger-like uncharacterized protein
MDIRCERCATEYELDESQVPDAGLPIKCATCGHVFKVFKPAPPSATLRLTRDGAVSLLPCPDEGTLEQWIKETRIIASDEISFDGATWERLRDIPEVAGMFPPPAPPVPPMIPTPVALPSLDLGEKTPSLHGMTLGAGLPSLSLPMETLSDVPKLNLPSLSLPADGTLPSLPKLDLPSLSLPTEPPKFESKSALKAAPAADTARTVQVKSLTSDQIATAKGEAPKSAKPAEAGVTLPSLNLEPPPTAQPVSAPRAAPKETSPVVTGTSKPVAKGEEKKSEKKADSKKDAAKQSGKATNETDLEVAAFKKQGQGGRIAAIALGGAAVLGGVGYVAWQRMQGAVPETAKASFEKGRSLYLTDTRANFAAAEAAFQDAIKQAGSAPYAAPYAGLAELHAAWGEPLFAKGSALLKQWEEKQEAAKKDPENKELAQAVAALGTEANAVNKEVSDHLRLAQEFAEKAIAIDRENVAARRALLDVFRVTNAEQKAQAQIATLQQLKATDPETNAHVAVVAGSEETLTASVQANPQFVRAYVWLADLHQKAKKEAELASDWNAVLQVAPQHEAATEALAALKPAQPPAETKPEETKPETKKPQKVAEAKPEEKKPVEPKAAEKTPEVRTAESKPAEKPEPSPVAAINVDSVLGQADKLFEKGKFQKALELYEKAAAARPTSAEAHFGVGLSQQSLNKLDAAIASFRKTLELSPRFGDAMISLAETLKAKGQGKEAAKYYRQYLDYFPKGEYASAAKQNVDALK